MIKVLDFVITPEGAVAFVDETNNGGSRVSLTYLGGGRQNGERNAWWDASDLKVIDNLPSLLSRNLCHPFGDGKNDALMFYPIINETK